MRRRDVAAGILGAIGAGVQLGTAVGQVPDNTPVDVNQFMERMADEAVRRIVYIDVDFVHSWRVALAPRGYENKDNWEAMAAENLNYVANALRDNVRNVIATAGDDIVAYDKIALSVYEDNKGSFGEFMGAIGINTTGKVADRLTRSLHDFALLNAAVYRSGVTDQAKHSYFWPLC
jgi:hypothetical protein